MQPTCERSVEIEVHLVPFGAVVVSSGFLDHMKDLPMYFFLACKNLDLSRLFRKES